MSPSPKRLLLLAAAAGGATAFVVPSGAPRCTAPFALGAKKAKKAKGFGKQTTSDDDDVPLGGSDYDSAADISAPAPTKNAAGEVVGSSAYDDDDGGPQLNAGQQALQRMRDQRQAAADKELRAVSNLRAVDDALREDAGVAAIPEKVAMRMGKRMLPFVGIPLFGTMGAFVAFWYLATYKDYEFQPAAVATVTVGFLVTGLLGITYSMLSASWDPDREGSTFGADEFNRNVGNLKEGLSRSRENALLRERMAGMPEEEIRRALNDLDKRDEKRKRDAEGLREKMEREME
mmetsp:Transcript_18898/g.54744  ORF Transcript_18898/g.54744 Transcript_18898/m.54744 type:complete len:290 (-) Transcript_18898:646-1515(-)